MHEFMAEMLEQIGAVNPGEQVSPYRVLLIGENEFLVFSSVFPRRVNVLPGDISGVNCLTLILFHIFTFLYEEGSRYEENIITAIQVSQGNGTQCRLMDYKGRINFQTRDGKFSIQYVPKV